MWEIIRQPLRREGKFTHRAAVWVSSAVGLFLLSGASSAQQAPVIDGLGLSSPIVAPGGTISVVVRAHDPDCVDSFGNPTVCVGPSGALCGKYLRDDLTTWNPASPGTWVGHTTVAVGNPSDPSNTGPTSPYVATNSWTAPAVPGAYTLTVTVADSGTFMCGGRKSASSSILVNVAAGSDLPPVINSLTATPTLVFPGDTVALACAATDPQGGSITYSWSTDAGTVTAGASGAATFTAASPVIANVVCTVTGATGLVAMQSVPVAVTEAKFDHQILAGLVTPQRVGADHWGDLYVADRGAGGLVAVRLTGELLYTLPLADVSAVAVDWNDNLLVGRPSGAELRNRAGALLQTLTSTPGLGEISDVAVDATNRRYAVLYRWPARVEIYDQTGTLAAAFGSPGDGPTDLRTPSGIAFTATGDVAIADQGHGQVKLFSPSGTWQRSIAGPGSSLGKFSNLDDVEVSPGGAVLASDTFQSWVQSLDQAGNLREVFGGWGNAPGQLETPAGVLSLPALARLVVTSINTSSLQVYRFTDTPLTLPQPATLLAPTALAFTDQQVGTMSGAQSVVLTNTGAAPLGLRATTLTGDFVLTAGCPPVLDPNTSCAVQIAFQPGAVGPRLGSLSLDTSVGTPLTVALSGAGFSLPALVVSPGGLAFGFQRLNTTSVPQSVRIANAGSLPLALNNIWVTGEFAQTNDCGTALAGGASCTIQVSFAPQTIATWLTGNLMIDEAVGGQHPVSLSGVSAGSAVAASPASLSFGQVRVGDTSPPQTLTLTNSGNVAATLGALGLTGSQPGSWQIRNDFCSGLTLTPGATCTLVLVFRPLLNGALTAAVHLASGSDVPLADVTLSGNGNAQSLAEIPTLSDLGLTLLALVVAGLGLLALRRRSRGPKGSVLGLVAVALLAGATLASAQTPDPPHWSSQSTANPGGLIINCSVSALYPGLGCHQGHNALGAALTNQAGNSNVCQQCHATSQVAAALPIANADKAVPQVSGTSHAFDVAAVNGTYGTTAPANTQMALRMAGGNITCSVCHNQHAASSALGGASRVSAARKTTTGTSPVLLSGGTYTGTAGLWYLVEIAAAGTETTARYHYSKDRGVSWTPSANCTAGGTVTGCLTASPTAATIDATTGVTLAFPVGSYTLSEKYEFSASWPFLRAALDSGDNTTGTKFCRDCHGAWTMDHVAAHTYTGALLSHPVGVALNANGGGYDRAVPLDANGVAQGGAGDGNPSNDFRLDAGGRVQCLSCHAPHFAVSNSLVVNQP